MVNLFLFFLSFYRSRNVSYVDLRLSKKLWLIILHNYVNYIYYNYGYYFTYGGV